MPVLIGFAYLLACLLTLIVTLLCGLAWKTILAIALSMVVVPAITFFVGALLVVAWINKAFGGN